MGYCGGGERSLCFTHVLIVPVVQDRGEGVLSRTAVNASGSQQHGEFQSAILFYKIAAAQKRYIHWPCALS